jgi:putative MATE family efflux protein
MTGFVDFYMIGRYGMDNNLGPDPLAAIGLANNALSILFSLAMGIGIGLSTLVALYTGKGDHRGAVTVAVDTFWFVTIFAIIIMVAGRFFLHVYNSSERVTGYLFDYLIIFINGMFVVLISMVVFSLMQGTGDTLTPTIILSIINLLNIIFNWILIPGPVIWGIDTSTLGLGMGIKGAAIGTVLARLIGCVIVFTLMFSGRYRIDMRKAERFFPLWRGVWPVLSIGLPSAFQFVSRNFSVLVLNFIISFSSIKEKAHAVLNTGFLIEWIPFGPAMALTQAAAIIVGQGIGAGLKDRAERAAHTAFGFSLIIMCMNALLFWFWPEMLARMFTDDKDVIASLANYLKIIGVSDIFLASLIYAGAIRAAGDATRPMLVNVLAIWVLRIPLAWAAMKYTHLDYTGVWLAMAFSQMVQGIALVILFRTGGWKKMKIIRTREYEI